MAAHWFRIAYAQGALRRSLAADGLVLDELTAAGGIRAMLSFQREYRPQHAELDELICQWGPVGDHVEFALVRRMRRHDHPEASVSLVFDFALTPARAVSGASPVSTERDATSTDGYRAIARAAVLARRIV